ncbi:MAG: cysteine desulfurase family protein [Lachnospiraceae bacterium]|nr:cysteine desulfurase family protein [Lachnospiraceae bacterium]
MEIYFDNSSTTRPSSAVCDIVLKTMTEDYGNPSSLHRKGVDAEHYIKDARKIIADILKVQEQEVYFTSGGTESNNWALIGGALSRRRSGNRILTTSMEHPAVSEPLHMLENFGFTVEKIPVDAKGMLQLDRLEAMLGDDVILVSTMYVNNEIGAVVPVEKVASMVHAHCPDALYHVDAIQAFGKYRIYPKKTGIDMLSVSGHKLHGPKGTGFLYVRNGSRLQPIIYGGGQQKGMRSGTENVPGIAGLSVACREAYEDFDAKMAHIQALHDRMTEGLQKLDDVVVHGSGDACMAPHIVHAAFVGVGSEVLLHSLEDRGIYISAGSACSTHKRSASPTMTAIEASPAEVSSSVRFSFCETNTEEEVDTVLAVLAELLPKLRRYRPR